MPSTAKKEPILLARIYLIRHGETQENRDGIIQGQRDTVLNETGVGQVRKLGEALRGAGVDFGVMDGVGRAWSSDLARAVSTADAILKYHDGVELVKDRELRERAMGQLEGKSGHERKSAGAKLALSVDSTAETSAEFQKRVVGWWNRTIMGGVVREAADERLRRSRGYFQQASAPEHPENQSVQEAESNSNSENVEQMFKPVNVLVTTHGGFITTLIQQLIGSKKLSVAPGVVVWRCLNSSVSVIEINSSQKGVLVKYGDIAHLTGYGNEGEAVESSSDWA